MPAAQVIFLDTPGVHESPRKIHKRMMDDVRQGLVERDALVWVVDGSRAFDTGETDALRIVESTETPVFAAINKVDLIRGKQQLLPVIESLRLCREFAEIVPVSAKTGEGLDLLLQCILRVLPEGPQYFPTDHITDTPERFLAAELIRERVLHFTRQEVPHAVAVLVEAWEAKANIVRIAATIVVERPGQKKILIGSGATLLKKIGTGAREEIEALLGKKVYLELFVKVRADWRENENFLNELDWR
jgi:GTP-binding protein Era